MNIFKFRVDLSRNEKKEEPITDSLKKAFSNGRGDKELEEYLTEIFVSSGVTFPNLFGEKGLLAVASRSSGRTSYFVTIENKHPGCFKETICIYVKTDDDDIYGQFKWVKEDFEKVCKGQKISVGKKVTELYLFLCSLDDVLYPDSSIKAKIEKKKISQLSLILTIFEIGIALLFFFAWRYDSIDTFSFISMCVAVVMHCITEIRTWFGDALNTGNLSQNMQSETGNGNSSKEKRVPKPNSTPKPSGQSPSSVQPIFPGTLQNPVTPALGVVNPLTNKPVSILSATSPLTPVLENKPSKP